MGDNILHVVRLAAASSEIGVHLLRNSHSTGFSLSSEINVVDPDPMDLSLNGLLDTDPDP